MIPNNRWCRIRQAWLLALIGMLPFGSDLSAALNPNEWKHEQTFELTETGLTKLSLPAATLDSAQRDLPDLRLSGPDGTEVPYVIEIPQPSLAARQAPRQFRVNLQRTATELTIETGTTQPIERITLATPSRSFVKAARVETSPDGSQWELLGDGFQLARIPGVDAVVVPLSRTRAAFVRITIDDWRNGAVPFTGAMLDLAAPEPAPVLPIEAEVVRRDEFARETVLTLDLHAAHVPLAAITFVSNEPLFARAVGITQRELNSGESIEQTYASGMIFRSRLPQQPVREQLEIPLYLSTASHELRVHVLNENNAPLAISAVRVTRRPVWMIFHATQPGTYHLLTGNVAVSAPRYDLARFAEDWKSLPETRAAITAPKDNPNYQRRDLLADMPVLGTEIDVSHWTLRKSISPKEAGVQELELDLEVLSHAAPGLSDLRLVRDGRQLPYLLERTAQRRLISLSVLSEEPKEPHLSRWKLSLPLAGVPVLKLTVTSRTRLFSRRLQVFETVTDPRGEPVRRVLSEFVDWRSTPERDEPKLSIDLFTTPLTQTLYLETDNGDNPPISLSEVKAEHSVVRLLFRTDRLALDLYYGAPGVPAPRYDLQLVAPQLLSEEKFPANLGPEESLNGRSAGRSLFSTRNGGVILWGSLAVVVGVLLFAIARLLPKPTEPPTK